MKKKIENSLEKIYENAHDLKTISKINEMIKSINHVSCKNRELVVKKWWKPDTNTTNTLDDTIIWYNLKYDKESEVGTVNFTQENHVILQIRKIISKYSL